MQWTHPIANPSIRGVDRAAKEKNTFGMVRRYPNGEKKPHQGWDYAAPIGTPVLAVADGTVVLVRDQGDYGLQVLVEHDTTKGRRWSFYAHLSRADVAVGDEVKQGQEFALSGESGNAEGMAAHHQHLHFEVRTERSPGLGLDGRVSPIEQFGSVPW